MKCPWMFHWVIVWSFLYIFILYGSLGIYPFQGWRQGAQKKGLITIQPGPTRCDSAQSMWCNSESGAHCLKVSHLGWRSDWFGHPHLPLLWLGLRPADTPCDAALPLFSLTGTLQFSRVPQAFVSGLPHSATVPCAQCWSTAMQGTPSTGSLQAWPPPAAAQKAAANARILSGMEQIRIQWLTSLTRKKKIVTYIFSPLASRAVSILFSETAFSITRQLGSGQVSQSLNSTWSKIFERLFTFPADQFLNTTVMTLISHGNCRGDLWPLPVRYPEQPTVSKSENSYLPAYKTQRFLFKNSIWPKLC